MTVSPTISLSTAQTISYITITQLPGAVDYILERATDADFADVVSTPSTSLPFYSSSSNVPNSFRDYASRPVGKTYYYRIRAINGISYSNVVSCAAPTATLSGSQTITNGQSATYTVALTGTAPWNVRVGGTTYSNVMSSPLQIVTAPFQALQQTYTQTTSGGSVTNICSTAPLSGTAFVTVLGTCPTVSVTLTYGSIGCGNTTTSGSIFTNPVYAPHWRNITTGVDYSGAGTFASNLTAGTYTIDLTGQNGCTGPQQRFTIRDYGPNGSTATLSGPANNRLVRGQQTSIRVELTGTAPWSVTYTGRGNKQLVAGNITTASYDIAVLPDSTTTYRLVAVSGQCSASAVSGSATLIIVPPLAELEYFVDADPGIGRATPLSVGFNQPTTNQTISIPLQNSPVGVHTLGFRAKDGDGYWSATTIRPFVVFGTVPVGAKSITQVEYILDGVDSRTAVSVAVDNNQPIALPVSLSLSPGSHTISTRAKDNMGRWSNFSTRAFVVIPTSSGISRIEYYFDAANPSLGNGTALSFSPANSTAVTAQGPVSVSGLDLGAHTVSFRAKTGDPVWSTTKTASFTVTNCFQALAQLIGSYTATTGQPVSVSVGFGGSSPWSLTANGQVFTNITTPSVSFTVQYPTSGSYSVNAQTAGISVANSCGTGVVSGTATVTVTGNCTTMYTIKTGAWNDASVWSCGRVPTALDDVEIRHGVQIPANYVASAKKLTYTAIVGLTFGLNARLKVSQ